MTLAPERYFEGPQLELARAVQRADLAAVRSLAPRTDLRAPGAEQATPAHYALHEALAREPERLAVLRDLVACDPGSALVPGAEVGSVLEASLMSTHPEFLAALLDAGVPPDARVAEGTVPAIAFSATDACIANVRLLLDRGAQADARDPVGDTALVRALAESQLDVVELLLERGASPRVVNRLGVSFLYMLSIVLDEEALDSPVRPRLEALRNHYTWQGLPWPPSPPEAERDAMRERGEEPVVPAGHTR